MPDLSPAAAGGIHTFPWPRAAVQHQRQQSRTKCQTLLQVSTKVALKIQIKPAQNQRQDREDRPRDVSALRALCEHQSPRVAQLLLHLFGGAESPWAKAHPDTQWPHSAASKPLHSRGLIPLQVTAPCATTPSCVQAQPHGGEQDTPPKPSVSTPGPPLSPSPHPTRLPLPSPLHNCPG